MAHTSDTDLTALSAITDATVIFETDSGDKYVLREAFVMEPASLKTTDGHGGPQVLRRVLRKDVAMSQVIDAAAKLSEAEDAVTAPLADSHIVTFADGVTIGTVHSIPKLNCANSPPGTLSTRRKRPKKSSGSRDAVTLVSSPARMGIELLRRQVKRLRGGDSTHNGPLSVEELGRLSIADFERLRLVPTGSICFPRFMREKALNPGGETLAGML